MFGFLSLCYASNAHLYAHIILFHVASEHVQYMHKMATPESAETPAPANAGPPEPVLQAPRLRDQC